MLTRKILIISASIFLFTRQSFSHPFGNFDEWGKVTLDDLNVTECSFEKNADVILLLDLGDVYYQNDKSTFFNPGAGIKITSSYYQRFKVLTEKGAKKADFKLRYWAGSKESITDVKAVSYNLDENGQIIKTELLASDIHYNKLSQNENEVVFSIPNVKKGSVFELLYKRHQIVNYSLPEWFFNTGEPSLKSRIRINFLDAFNYHIQQHIHKKGFTVEKAPFTSDIWVDTRSGYEKLKGSRLTCTAVNLRSIQNEPFMNSQKNYTDRISFQLLSVGAPFSNYNSLIRTWNDYTSYLLSKPEFGGNISGDALIPRKEWKAVLTENMTPLEKTKAIFEFVRQNLKWDGRLTAMPRNDHLNTWKVKNGNSAEINILLINTLRKAGLKAFPMLVTNRASGYVDKEYPMVDQFKNILAFVDLGEGNEFVLDATNKFLPFGLIEFNYLDNSGFIIRADSNYDWYTTFDRGENSETVNINARLDEEGKITGEIRAVYDNYTAAFFRRLKTESNDNEILDYIKKRAPNITIESTADSVDEDKNRFIEKIKFSKHPISDDEGNIYISLTDIYGQSTNPFADSERVSDVDFGYKQKTNSLISLILSPNYVVDTLIKPTLMITADSSIRFLSQAEADGNVLFIKQELEYKESFYPVKYYADFFEFHKKYYNMIQQPVVLKKKK